MTTIQKRSIHIIFRMVLVAILPFQTMSWSFPKVVATGSGTREVVTGVRIANGDELYFRDCTLLDAAVNEEETTSEGTDGCLGVTPLVWAVAHYPGKVAALLEAGADPYEEYNGGNTALHLALSRGSYKVAARIQERQSALGEVGSN